jgi:YidC/Oxa1 family membrane protein insertase
MFDFIGHLFDMAIMIPLLNLLVFFHQWVGDFGLLLMLFAVVLLGITWPISIYSMRSQKHTEQALKAVQLQAQELKERYKGGNTQELNAELRSLYKQHNIHPLGGCFWTIIPVICLLALWSILGNVVVSDARHLQPGMVNTLLYPFVPHLQAAINTDLTWFSGINHFELNLAAAEAYPIHVLALLAGLLVFVQVWLFRPRNTNQDAQRKGRWSEILTPVIAVLLTVASFWVLPAGLALFWIGASMITLFQQFSVNGWKL